ncbi:MAG: ABC-2 family transporter protein [Nocardioidaceae bacterium]|nr:ABC-2 family transporter protein [Nocardioidaceae bacterium]
MGSCCWPTTKWWCKVASIVRGVGWNLQAYLVLARMWIRVSMTYRASFVTLALGQFFITGLDFVGIAIMFSKVDTLGGFTLAEVAFLYGGSALCLGIADLLLGNIERLGVRIRMGTFDTMLVRPVSVFVQMCADEFALRRLGRITQAIAVFVWSVTALDIDWTAARMAMLPYLVGTGAVIFLAIFTLGAAVQFWTADSSELANAFTYGGSTLACFPLTIYPREAIRALTFVVPLGFVNWYPSLFILDKPDPLGLPSGVEFAGPIAAALLSLLAAVLWRYGIRRYQSTGS